MKLTTTAIVALASLAVFSTAELAYAKRGADDPKGHVRQGRGKDDGKKHAFSQSDVLQQIARRGRGRDDGPRHA